MTEWIIMVAEWIIEVQSATVYKNPKTLLWNHHTKCNIEYNLTTRAPV